MAVTALDRDEVRQASTRLPERQRAALELREGRGLSYEQIAATLGTSAGAVAQLLERARINLYDELRGTALASVAAPSAECERALSLIAARQDGELAAPSEDASWLDVHLSGCDRCRLAAGQMAEAAALYRGEAPASAAAAPAAPATDSSGPAARPRRYRVSRRRMALAGSLAGLALAGIVVALIAGNGSPAPAPSAADAAARRNTAQGISEARVVETAHDARSAAKHPTKRGPKATVVATSQAGSGDSSAAPVYTPPLEGSNGGSRGTSASSPPSSHGDTAVQPAKQMSTAKPEPKPPPSSAQASQPTAPPASETAPPPAEEPTPPAEEPTAEHGHAGEPPGKPADRPAQK